MSGVTFRPAPAVERVAKTLISKYHMDLSDHDVDIRYVFRSEHAKSSGKAVFGRAKKISGLNAYLAALDDPDETGIEGAEGDFFVIEIAEDIWRELKQDARVALVDHELSHCGVTFDKDENLKLVCLPHDLEEFNAIVERHGLWRPDVAEFDKALRLSFEMGVVDHVEEEVASRDNFDQVDNVLRDGAGYLDEKRAKELAGGSVVDAAVQSLVDAVPEGTSMTMTTSTGKTATIDKTKGETKPKKPKTSSSSTESAPPADAAPASDDPLAGTQEASDPANGAEDQEGPVVDGSESSTDTGGDPAGGADTDPPGPQLATPAQRLSLGRHIAALDEALTNEFMEWCRKQKCPLNPQEMTFEQARAALILVGEREPSATE